MQSAVLLLPVFSRASGTRGEASGEFRIELRGTPAKEADCIRPTSTNYRNLPRTTAETHPNS